MATQSEIFSFGATHVVVGLSALVPVRVANYEFGHLFKIQSGGGTLEIVPIPAALSGSSAAGWGLGYPIGSSEAITLDGPSTFYLAATGATMIGALIVGRTSGATFL